MRVMIIRSFILINALLNSDAESGTTVRPYTSRIHLLLCRRDHLKAFQLTNGCCLLTEFTISCDLSVPWSFVRGLGPGTSDGILWAMQDTPLALSNGVLRAMTQPSSDRALQQQPGWIPDALDIATNQHSARGQRQGIRYLPNTTLAMASYHKSRIPNARCSGLDWKNDAMEKSHTPDLTATKHSRYAVGTSETDAVQTPHQTTSESKKSESLRSQSQRFY